MTQWLGQEGERDRAETESRKESRIYEEERDETRRKREGWIKDKERDET